MVGGGAEADVNSAVAFTCLHATMFYPAEINHH
ncbi:hypothetical protein EV382_2168 [Micromonospora violae]|uniref:Uncharacterized protein n=1 Tax=Micromonospora violae TaxID=1278207 RepID=A0A4Q7UCQ5_9ACTN|nr:hypothetical protein EV382_2168 [Micromonospora violae]